MKKDEISEHMKLKWVDLYRKYASQTVGLAFWKLKSKIQKTNDLLKMITDYKW